MLSILFSLGLLGHAQETSEEVEETGLIEHFEVSRPWRKPDFGSQVGALGYTPDTFRVPQALDKRVQFWIDIYSKYSSEQGVLHDSKYVHFVYEPVDLSYLSSALSRRDRARAQELKIKVAKERLRAVLLKLDTMTSPEQLDSQEKRIWTMFAEVTENHKFREAADRVRFQLGQRDLIQLGIYYSGRYLEQMEETFREEGLPIELTRMPFVESSFNIYARSKVGASGIWQFMRSTAKAYMKVTAVVDERNDPLAATKAAAKKLRANYRQLLSWPLAITGYNHGPSGVQRLSEKLQTTNIQNLIEDANQHSKTFGFASQNFYACFLAVLEVERNADNYFGRIVWSPRLESREMLTQSAWTKEKLLSEFAGNDEKARLYNPHINWGYRKTRTIPIGTKIYLPIAQETAAQ